jgi:hypothetical protein
MKKATDAKKKWEKHKKGQEENLTSQRRNHWLFSDP